MSYGQKPRFLGNVIESLLVFSAILVCLAASAPFFAAVAITAWQIKSWLRTGVWVSQPTSAYVSLPPDFLENWVGARAIADWFVAVSIQVPLIFCSILLFALIVSISEAYERKRRERNRQKPPPRDY
jgi:hypothetical protein